MAKITNQDVLSNLQRFAKATCLIETSDGCWGTGFHFGDGWIMSAAHNFKTEGDSIDSHSLLRGASFTFKTGEGSNTIFDSQADRMAFINHLQYNSENIDREYKDIAMIKLGEQYQYARKNGLQQWEIEEKDKLKELELIPFGTIEKREVSDNDEVYTIHYGNRSSCGGILCCLPCSSASGYDYGRRNMAMQTVGNVTGPNASPYPTFKLSPAVPHGASGCPILSNDFKLVGLLFGGNDDEDDALMFDSGIRKYINTGVEVIAGSGSYLAWKGLLATSSGPAENERVQEKALNERQELQKLAGENKLTIYLMNGERIPGWQNQVG